MNLKELLKEADYVDGFDNKEDTKRLIRLAHDAGRRDMIDEAEGLLRAFHECVCVGTCSVRDFLRRIGKAT